jgi:hypothetical protein
MGRWQWGPCGPLGLADRSRYPYHAMADKEDRHVLAAPADVDEAIETPTAIDGDELAKARRDERWREFCLNAEDYVAATTRKRPRVEQPA